MGYFPFFIDIENKSCLIVGGGKVAYRKIKKLIPYGPIIKVVAEDICEEILSLEYDRLDICRKSFEFSDIEGAFFVITATDDEKLNAEISDFCRSRGILINAVDSKDNCGFIFPSLYKRGGLSIGISTGGASPNLSAHCRNILEKNLPSKTESIVDFLSGIRSLAKERIPDDKKRSAFFKECMELSLSLNAVPSDDDIEGLFEKYSGGGYSKKGHVHIVGAGCSDSDLITVRGLNLVQNADVIIYDDLISDELLDTAKESCEKIYAGKRSGRHYMKQDEINALIVKKAEEGNTVVRLKGGDPFVFGRGGEEIAALMERGIPFDEVPGITSAIAIPAEAGIPVTHRGLSRSLHIITGHTADTVDGVSENIEKLAVLEGTLVFLMGLSNMERICSRLIECGKDKNTPAAVISGGNSENKVTVRAPLGKIAEECRIKQVKSPVTIVIGPVADLDMKC